MHTSGFLGLEEKLFQLGTICKNNRQLLKFSIAEALSALTYGQRFRLQRSPKVKDFILGLEISADNFRTNIDTGKLFTSLRFFRKGTPNYVYIDLKRSPSNLTLGQCLRHRNCVKLYIIRLVLMGQRCLNYFLVPLDQKTISTNETNVPYEKGICIIHIARN